MMRRILRILPGRPQQWVVLVHKKKIRTRARKYVTTRPSEDGFTPEEDGPIPEEEGPIPEEKGPIPEEGPIFEEGPFPEE